jgi:hypothetical protein
MKDMNPVLSSTLRVVCGLALAAVLFVCLRGSRPPNSLPSREQSESPITREQLNALIDSLANRNEQPAGGGMKRPVYHEGYDQEEDARVVRVATVVDRFPSETLWHCLVEHFDDKRYVIDQRRDEPWLILTIGHVCKDHVKWWLDAPYQPWIDEDVWRVVRSDTTIAEWCAAHQDLPIVEQQILVGEELLKKATARSAELKRRFGEKDEKELRELIQRQIETLKRTKQPMNTNMRMIPRA